MTKTHPPLETLQVEYDKYVVVDANKIFCECTVFKWNQERQREMFVFLKYVDAYNFKTHICHTE